MTEAVKATVERNSNDVSSSVERMSAAKMEAMNKVSTYGLCAEFIKQTKAKGLPVRYANASFVGTKALANAPSAMASSVMIYQVVSSQRTEKYPRVVECQRIINANSKNLVYDF